MKTILAMTATFILAALAAGYAAQEGMARVMAMLGAGAE